jgi:hypothetical protein
MTGTWSETSSAQRTWSTSYSTFPSNALRATAKGGERGRRAAGSRLVAHGEQDGLLVLGLHLVDQPRHLRAVADQPRRRLGAARFLDQPGDEVGEQRGGHGERYADEDVELAPERPSAGAWAALRGRRRRTGRRVHLVRGHQASCEGVCEREDFTWP